MAEIASDDQSEDHRISVDGDTLGNILTSTRAINERILQIQCNLRSDRSNGHIATYHSPWIVQFYGPDSMGGLVTRAGPSSGSGGPDDHATNKPQSHVGPGSNLYHTKTTQNREGETARTTQANRQGSDMPPPPKPGSASNLGSNTGGAALEDIGLDSAAIDVFIRKFSKLQDHTNRLQTDANRLPDRPTIVVPPASSWFHGSYNWGFDGPVPGLTGSWEYTSYGDEGSSEDLASTNFGGLPELQNVAHPTAEQMHEYRRFLRESRLEDPTRQVDLVWVPTAITAVQDIADANAARQALQRIANANDTQQQTLHRDREDRADREDGSGGSAHKRSGMEDDEVLENKQSGALNGTTSHSGTGAHRNEDNTADGATASQHNATNASGHHTSNNHTAKGPAKLAGSMSDRDVKHSDQASAPRQSPSRSIVSPSHESQPDRIPTPPPGKGFGYVVNPKEKVSVGNLDLKPEDNADSILPRAETSDGTRRSSRATSQRANSVPAAHPSNQDNMGPASTSANRPPTNRSGSRTTEFARAPTHPSSIPVTGMKSMPAKGSRKNSHKPSDGTIWLQTFKRSGSGVAKDSIREEESMEEDAESMYFALHIVLLVACTSEQLH